MVAQVITTMELENMQPTEKHIRHLEELAADKKSMEEIMEEIKGTMPVLTMSFDRNDTSALENIFINAVRPIQGNDVPSDKITILSHDDVPVRKTTQNLPTREISDRKIPILTYETEMRQDNADLDGYCP